MSPQNDQINNRADDRANEIRATYQSSRGDAGKDAYLRFRDELQKDQEDFFKKQPNGQVDPDAFKNFTAYWDRLSKDLVDSKLLPELSIAWEKDPNNKFHNQLDKAIDGKSLTKDKLARLASGEGMGDYQGLDSGFNVSALDRMMIKGFQGMQEEQLTRDGLKKFDNESEKKLRNDPAEVRTEVATLTDRLLKSQNGQTLFGALDQAGSDHGDDNDDRDGSISKHDLQKFIDYYEKEGKRNGAYSDENYQLVKALYDSWDNDGPYRTVINTMREGGNREHIDADYLATYLTGGDHDVGDDKNSEGKLRAAIRNPN